MVLLRLYFKILIFKLYVLTTGSFVKSIYIKTKANAEICIVNEIAHTIIVVLAAIKTLPFPTFRRILEVL